MAKRPRKPRFDKYEAYKVASGWYLAAWRDFRGLTLEDLADEAKTSKGVVSDLETGAKRANGTLAQRFNRDDLVKFSKALETSDGFLLTVNPFMVDASLDLGGKIQRLDATGRSLVSGYIDALLERSGTKD